MEKRNIASAILQHIFNLIQGALIGAFSMIPFTQVTNLKEGLQQKDFEIEGERTFKDYGKSMLHYLSRNCTYLLGFAIGMILFFIVSWETKVSSTESTFTSYYTYAEEFYHTAVYMGLLCLIPGTLIFEGYRYTNIVRRRVKGHAGAIIAGVITCGISLLAFFFLPGSFKEVNALALLVFMFIGLLGTLLTSYLGVSIGTVLFFSTFYLQFSDLMNEFIRTRSNIAFVILFLLGCLIGYVLSTLLGFMKKPFQREKIGARIGFYVAGIIAILATKIKEPFLNEEATALSQNLTIASTMLGALMVSVGLTIHGYKFFNKQELKEENNETR